MMLELAAIWRISIVASALSRPVATAILSATALVCVLVGEAGTPAHAETISSALARAYAFSPDLNAQRAGLRATDENLPTAVAGYRPTVTAAGDVGYEKLDLETPRFRSR